LLPFWIRLYLFSIGFHLSDRISTEQSNRGRQRSFRITFDSRSRYRSS
jgi:hypothetical protein